MAEGTQESGDLLAVKEAIIKIMSDEDEEERKKKEPLPTLPILGKNGEGKAEQAQEQTSPGETRERVTLTAEIKTTGEFEIACITAGIGNGWEFPAGVLQESLSLWDGAQCFVDHDWFGHSIKDLAGVIHAATWSTELSGITAHLKPVGPNKDLVLELGKEMLEDAAKPNIGFSADVLFTAKGKKVEKILRVFSVDMVLDPARGGAFLRALNSLGGARMADKEEVTTPTPSVNQTALEKDQAAIRQLLEVQQSQAKLAEEAEKAKAIRVQMCEYLLTSGLAASKLPAPAAERVRMQFTGKVFEPTELVTAIEDTRKLVSELTGAMVVNGPGRVSAMFNTDDQLQAAVDDLLGAERDADKKTLKAARLSGVRELYMMLTGDQDLHGGYHPDHVHLATTTDFSGLVKNALNKIVVQRWGELGRAGYDWWQRIVTTEHFNSLNTITGTLVGTVGTLPTVAEGGEYTELAIGDSPETADFVKYGGYIPLTLELIDRDETRKLRAYPAELAAAGLRKISALVAAIFTSAAGAGPTMADTGALFNAVAVTTKGGHTNYLTTALAAAQWEVVQAAVYNQPLLIRQDVGYYGTGPKMGINPRYCLVPRALELTAKKILYPAWENLANIHSENVQQGSQGDVVTVPEWTDATDWAAVCDPRIAPAIFVGERFGLMPEIFIAGNELDPAVFANDEHRLKVRHFLAVWVNDFRPLHHSVVGG